MRANQTQQPLRPLCAGSAVQLLRMQFTADGPCTPTLITSPVMAYVFKKSKALKVMVFKKIEKQQKFHAIQYVYQYK